VSSHNRDGHDSRPFFFSFRFAFFSFGFSFYPIASVEHTPFSISVSFWLFRLRLGVTLVWARRVRRACGARRSTGNALSCGLYYHRVSRRKAFGLLFIFAHLTSWHIHPMVILVSLTSTKYLDSWWGLEI